MNIGIMHLMDVKSIVFRDNNHEILEIFLVRGTGWQLAATRLHAFAVFRDGNRIYLPTDQLHPGDKIWVDQSSFLADGSLTLKG